MIKVYTSETLCCTGEEEGSPRKCNYTLGALWSALRHALDKRFQVKHAKSVLRGGKHDMFEFVKFQ